MNYCMMVEKCVGVIVSILDTLLILSPCKIA